MQCLLYKSRYMIVVAAGKGLRFGNDIPKQFLPIKGKPILMRTLENIKYSIDDIKIVLVLPKEHQDYWLLLCKEYAFDVEHVIAHGGLQRFYSVKNGLEYVGDNSIVGVHDGVRPFVSKDVIQECFFVAEQRGNAVPCVNPVETIRVDNRENTQMLDRDKVWLVQTPQCFDAKILKRAYSKGFDESFTDDASVVESIGVRINIVQGNRENIKITNPLDMLYAEALL